MDGFDAVVVGGGFAGLCAAERLAGEGARVLLLEQEPIPAAHASGRNAAIWLPVGELASTGPLARRSAERLDAIVGRGWLERTGALITATDPGVLEPMEATAPASGCSAQLVSAQEAIAHCPALLGGTVRAALVVEGAGILDIHAMTSALATEARSAGAAIRFRARVRRVVVEGAVVRGIELDDGERIAAPLVVAAPGAWAAELAAAAGTALALVPMRRHLAHVQLPEGVAVGRRVVWHAEPEVYFRVESGGILASPCDAVEHAAGVPETKPEGLHQLATRLRAIAPALRDARVASSWACLRTFAPDRELVIGEDARVGGLFWFAGFGGRGMTVAPAAAEVLAACVARRAHPLAATFDPSRLAT